MSRTAHRRDGSFAAGAAEVLSGPVAHCVDVSSTTPHCDARQQLRTIAACLGRAAARVAFAAAVRQQETNEASS
jgi:hypothetical protein